MKKKITIEINELQLNCLEWLVTQRVPNGGAPEAAATVTACEAVIDIRKAFNAVPLIKTRRRK